MVPKRSTEALFNSIHLLGSSWVVISGGCKTPNMGSSTMVDFLMPSLLESALIFPDMSSVRIAMRAPSPRQFGVWSFGLCIAVQNMTLSVNAITVRAARLPLAFQHSCFH